LDSPYLWSEERDYPKIVQRYTQAAERQHWKAMMNLVTLQIEGRGLPRDPEAVVKRVEAAMQLGIPAAYDRMGTLYQRGIGVKGDATRAFAFFQRAADMGSPESQTYLGEKMDATYDDPKGGFWGNKIIGQKMLQCAFAQGHGQAAFELGLTTRKTGDREANARSLRYFHEGVKMGSADSAAYLSRKFGRPNLADTINPGGIDKAREDRYWLFYKALDFNDLFNAAKPVIMTPEPEVPLSSQRRGRSYLPTTHTLIPMPSFGRSGMLMRRQMVGPRFLNHPCKRQQRTVLRARNPESCCDRLHQSGWPA